MPPKPLVPHMGVIANPSARRAACDPCHAQKLRCTKLETSNVCARCQRLARQCVWSAPLRSGRPATMTIEEKLAGQTFGHGDTAGGKSRKRPLGDLELTAEKGRPPGIAPINPNPIGPVAPNDQTQPQSAMMSVEIPEVPLLPPSMTDWNISHIFGLASPNGNAGEIHSPSLQTPDDEFPIPSLIDYFQLPYNGFAGLGNQTRPTVDGSAHGCTPRLGSLQNITHELSGINLSLFDLEQSLHAEPWGPMFSSPAAVISKLSGCREDQPDSTLAQGYPLTEIFDKTQRFIEIARHASVYFASSSTSPVSLSTFSSTTYPSSVTQVPERQLSRDLHPENDIPSQATSHASPPPLDMYAQSNLHPLRSATSQSTVQEDRPAATAICDLPTALLFTAGYARILDLYTTVLIQISHFVHALSAQSIAGGTDYRQRMHPVMPPLQWGGFQPANYGALQILMVIQVISFLLTDVERSLGVDEWEREVTQGRPRAGKDLISSAMIQLVLQADGQGNPRGRLELLRRKLREVKKQLETDKHV